MYARCWDGFLGKLSAAILRLAAVREPGILMPMRGYEFICGIIALYRLNFAF